MTAFVIEGARAILADRVERVSVRVENGTITGLDTARDGAEVIPAEGYLLAPALIDIHGDAFERQLMPRPGVMFPLDAAVMETDRQLAANGIATAYHALTLSWEPGLRSVAMARDVLGAIRRLSARLLVENRIQLRWETFCFEALPLIDEALNGTPSVALAFNDHTSMALLDPSVPLQTRPFEQDPDFPVTDTETPKFRQKMEARAARSGLANEAFVALLRAVWARRPEVPAAIATLAGQARMRGVPMLSHDDSQPVTRTYYRDLGAHISEFPMNRVTAAAAKAAGDMIVFGAPNAARGGSHLGSPDAAEMVAEGLCDILASDYYYPAMLAGVARLHADGAGGLHRLWQLVAANPARALGLADRGEIRPGLRADLVLLDWPQDGPPAPLRTWVAGRSAWASAPGVPG